MVGRRSSNRGKASNDRYSSKKTVHCELCDTWRDARGHRNHLARCEQDHEREAKIAAKGAAKSAAKRRSREDDDNVHRTPKRGRHTRQNDPTPPQSPLITPADAISDRLEGLPQPQPDGLELPQLPTGLQSDASIASSSAPPSNFDIMEYVADSADRGLDEDNNFTVEPGTYSINEAPPPLADTPTTRLSTTLPPQITPALDDIKVEYHQASGRPTRVYSFAQFTRDEPAATATLPDDDSQSKPWKPFKSRLDFDLAELTHETRMNRRQISRLLEIVSRIVEKKDRFTLKSVDEVDLAWRQAQLLYPSFQVTKYPVVYKDKEYTFDFHHRPLWPWLMSQVQDPLLAKHFRWDSQRLYKYDGAEWVRFIDEPWTAESFAKAQSRIVQIDPDGKPLAIIVWADTSHLSSSGGQKGHFIIAKIGNLPSIIRNGTSLGGGRIVGFIPLLPGEDPKEKGKTKYINFKHAIYHEAWREFLKEVAIHSRWGYKVHCGDNIPRSLYPFILIVSADYQEQCYFCLLRGLGGLAPCPVCLKPKGTLSDLKTQYVSRNSKEVQKLVEKDERVGEKEKILKIHGIRPVKNAFWNIENTDIHAAVSFDRLHAYSLGLFADHLFPELKSLVESLGRSEIAQLEDSVKGISAWSDLNHFNKGILDINFSDGSDWEDITKIIVNVSHHVLTRRKTSKGFALLRLIRKFIELNRFLSLDVQTTKTIAAFRRTLDSFHDRLQDYKHECRDDAEHKDWDAAIKVHSHTHAPQDILMKGVIGNMDTKSNERLNGPMRKAYLLQTNFKDVEHQLGKIEDKSLASCSIRAHIEAFDAAQVESQEEPKVSAFQFHNVYLGSRRITTIDTLAQQSSGDRAYHLFRSRLSNCINGLREHEGKHPVTVNGTDEVVDCVYMKVDYESLVNWRTDTDLLRCNPLWNGSPRYDTVIVNDGDSGLIFCRLVRLFVYTVIDSQEPYAFALVHPLNAPTGPRSGDFEIGLCRVREKNRVQSRIIPARSIVRGALVVHDPMHKGEYTVVDALDNDMFLRCIGLFPNRDIERVV